MFNVKLKSDWSCGMCEVPVGVIGVFGDKQALLMKEKGFTRTHSPICMLILVLTDWGSLRPLQPPCRPTLLCTLDSEAPHYCTLWRTNTSTERLRWLWRTTSFNPQTISDNRYTSQPFMVALQLRNLQYNWKIPPNVHFLSLYEDCAEEPCLHLHLNYK